MTEIDDMTDDEERYDCETCGDEGIVVTWVHREVWDGEHWTTTVVDQGEPCPDCTEFCGPIPPWADWPMCSACDEGYAIVDGAEYECILCSHTWAPIEAERAQMATTAAAARAEFVDDDGSEFSTWI